MGIVAALQPQVESASVGGHIGTDVVLRERAELFEQRDEVLLLAVVPRGSLVEAVHELLRHVVELLPFLRGLEHGPGVVPVGEWLLGIELLHRAHGFHLALEDDALVFHVGGDGGSAQRGTAAADQQLPCQFLAVVCYVSDVPALPVVGSDGKGVDFVCGLRP